MENERRKNPGIENVMYILCVCVSVCMHYIEKPYGQKKLLMDIIQSRFSICACSHSIHTHTMNEWMNDNDDEMNRNRIKINKE